MNLEEKIRRRIEQNLQYDSYELTNESHKHAGHVGDDGSGQTHFKLMVVSDCFSGISRLERHRMINMLLGPEIFDCIHALSMDLSAKDECKKK